MKMSKKLIVGLGNIGKEYENTRHNIGFIVLDKFREELRKENFTCIEKKQKDLFSHLFNYQDFILIYPQTYMNVSGKAVKAVLNYYKIPQENLIVIQDDVSLDEGRIKWTRNTGAGGHHGIESIFQSFSGFRDFIRLKYGVGPDPGGDRRADFVLSKFTDQELLENTINKSIESLRKLILNNEEFEIVMREYNG